MHHINHEHAKIWNKCQIKEGTELQVLGSVKVYIYILTYIRVDWKFLRLKSAYEDIISAVDDVFYHWDISTATLMEEVCGPQGELYLKNKPQLVTFLKSILVSLWTFHITLIHLLKYINTIKYHFYKGLEFQIITIYEGWGCWKVMSSTMKGN